MKETLRRQTARAWARLPDAARALLPVQWAQGAYEATLERQVRAAPMPRHVGVILDGNRRYAQSFRLAPAWGHREGQKRVEAFLDWCLELGLERISLWALSTDNFRRPESELTALFSILEAALERLAQSDRIARHQVNITAMGRLQLLPERLQERIRDVERQTAAHRRHYVHLAIGYGGREEIVDSVKRRLQRAAEAGETLAAVAEQFCEEDLEGELYVPHLPAVDLVIRTSGEQRLSGFLLWQCAHSELYFCEALWPEFRRLDFLRALRSYQARDRRFGK